MQLLQHFKELTIHPKNANELKGLILQLAIQGKLTKKWREENPDIDPASVLMTKIKTEKERLIKENKIKKEKSFLSEKVEIDFELPEGWELAKITDLASMKAGGDLPRSNYAKEKTEDFQVPIFANGEKNKGLYGFTDKPTVDRPSITVSGRGTIGYTEIRYQPFYPIVRLIVITPFSELVNLEFLKFTIKQTEFKNNGTSIPQLTVPMLKKKCLISLPPLEEQKAIVEIVNQLFEEVEQLEEQTKARIRLKADFVTSALQDLATKNTEETWDFLQPHFQDFFREKSAVKKLRETVLQLAVQGKLTEKWRASRKLSGQDVEPASVLLEKIKAEKEQLIKDKKIKKEKPLPAITAEEIPYELPEGWEWCRFGKLVLSMNNGLYKPAKFYTDNGLISLRMYNIKSGYIDFNDARRVELTGDELMTYELKPNDLLINRVNSHELIGKTAIIPEYEEELVYESMNIRTRLVFKDKIAKYSNLFLQSMGARNYLMSNSKQAIGQASINQSIISEMPFPLAPIDEQKAIVEKVNSLMNLCDQFEQEIEHNTQQVEQLMQSCLKEVFEGG